MLALLCSALRLTGQEEETLFKKVQVVGGFGGPAVSFSQAVGDPMVMGGGGGGVVIGDLFFGGFGEGGEVRKGAENEKKVGLSYGGLWFGYTPRTQKLLHPYLTMRVGWGELTVDYDNDDISPEQAEEPIFTVFPEAGLEVNVFKFMRLNSAVGYRLVTGVDGFQNYVSSDFNSPVLSVMLRFGRFW